MRKYILLAVALLSASLAVLARLKFNGLVYGLDYGLYHPDGADYSYKTLELMGKNSSTIASQVSAWYSENSLKIKEITPQEIIQGQITFPQSRVLYPILSIPFVKLFGLQGMLVVPILSFFILQMFILAIGVKLKRFEIAVVLVIAISMSPTVLRWMISDCSDSLFVAIVASVPILLNLANPVIQRILLIAVIISSTLTRFSLPIFLSIGVVLLVKKNIKLSALMIVTSFIANIPALSQSGSMIMPQSDMSFANKLVNLPASALKVGFIEIAQLAVLDRLLLLILIVSFVLALMNIKKDSSKYFFAVLLSVWGLGALNGTLGVNFRYQLPLIIFCCWVLLENLPKFSLSRNIHVKSEEA